MPKKRKKIRHTTADSAKTVTPELEDDLDLEDALDEEETTETADLESIYSLDDDEEEIDMTTLEQGRNVKRWIAFGLLGAVILAAIGYFGYVVFRNDFQGDGSVELDIVVDEQLASGDAVSVEITYQNNKDVDLLTGQIELFAPTGFVFDSATPEATENNRIWEIEDVEPGTGGKIRITGQLVGAKDDVKEFSALLTYTPKNFSTEFQESARATTTITSSIVEVDTEVPDQVSAGQEFTYQTTFTNTASASLDNVKVVLQYPEGFTVNSTEPDTFTGDNEWRFESLEPDAPVTIAVTGVLDGSSADTKEFNFQFGLIEIDNSFNVQLEQSSLVLIVNPEVELSLNAAESVVPGEPLDVALNVKNTADTLLRDVVVQLELDGGVFADDEYTFDTLDSLTPFDSAELSTQLTINDSFKNGSGTIRARVVSAVVDGATIEFPDTTAEHTVQAQGTVTATAIGRYFDKSLKKIGSGPIPPTVGETTTYVIEWSAESGSNDLTDFQMTTSLPDDVTWAADASDNIAYDSATGQVSLVRSTLSAGSSVSGTFAVSVTPTKSDIDSLLVLTRDTLITATDDVTGGTISAELARITTDLPQDEGAAGKGVVVAE